MKNSDTVGALEPAELWREFAGIADIPRPSRREAAVIAHIRRIAEGRGLDCRSDAAGNLLVCLPASPGREGRPGLILQAHVDMVCEQDEGRGHDFERDPIRLVVDGDWLRADRTTLGADNGLAVAMMLALAKGGHPHGPVDLLFTIDEESGLTGALNLDPALLRFRRLLNLDGEEEGIFYIGCAGGRETTAELPLSWRAGETGLRGVELALVGLAGGHSGADIHKQCGNALRLLGRFLYAEAAGLGLGLAELRGGDKHNAICREAFATAGLPAERTAALAERVAAWNALFRGEFGADEPGLALVLRETGDFAGPALAADCQAALLRLLVSLPHGVLGMSRSLPGLVATSSNLAALVFRDGQARFLTSQRADAMSTLADAGAQVRAVFEANGAACRSDREYPAWTPEPSSPLLGELLACAAARGMAAPTVTAIHAGLECGVIAARQGGMDMVSFGPDVQMAHTPSERAGIASTARVWDFLLAFLDRQ